MTKNLAIRKGSIAKWAISVYLLYMLWFQYAVTQINFVMPVCAVVLGLYIIINLKPLSFYRYLFPLLLFFVCCIISSLFSEPFSYGIRFYTNMVKYSIPMVAIFRYVDRDEKKLENVNWIISIACALVALSTIIKGRLTQTGATTLGELNTNVLSTYLMLGLISDCLLLTSNISLAKKRGIAGIIVLQGIAQLFAASRRGIIVFSLLCIIYLLVNLINLPSTRGKLLRYTFICSLVVIVTAFFSEELLNIVRNSTFFQRFLGNADTVGGNRLRGYYQEVAWDLFVSSPVIGRGLGVVAKYAGIYSHSMYYETLACTGIAGLLCILYLFWMLGKSCMRMKKIQKCSMRNANLIMIIWSIIAILLTGITVVLIYDSVFYILIAVITVSVRVRERDVWGGIGN